MAIAKRVSEPGAARYIQLLLCQTSAGPSSPAAVYESIRSRLRHHPFWSGAFPLRVAPTGRVSADFEIPRGHSLDALYEALRAAVWEAALRHKQPDETLDAVEEVEGDQPAGQRFAPS